MGGVKLKIWGGVGGLKLVYVLQQHAQLQVLFVVRN